MVLVFLVHSGGRWTSFDCHHIPADDSPVLRISEPANYRDNPGDPTGHTVLCAELPCAVGDAIWNASNVELAELVEEVAARTDLPDINVAEVQVHRSAMYYPSYTLGYDRDLQGLDSWLRGIPSVTSFGRFGLFFHDNTHHALLLAREAVNAFQPEGSFDHLAWRRAATASRRYSTESSSSPVSSSSPWTSDLASALAAIAAAARRGRSR